MRKASVAVLLAVPAGCSNRPTSEWVGELKAADGTQRLHAIRALSERPAEAATVVPALSAVLKDTDPFVRRHAALALAQFGAEARGALPARQPLLRDRNPHVRKAAAAAVKKIESAPG